MAMEFPVVEGMSHLMSAIPLSGEPKVLRSLFANGKEMPSESHAFYLEL